MSNTMGDLSKLINDIQELKVAIAEIKTTIADKVSNDSRLLEMIELNNTRSIDIKAEISTLERSISEKLAQLNTNSKSGKKDTASSSVDVVQSPIKTTVQPPIKTAVQSPTNTGVDKQYKNSMYYFKDYYTRCKTEFEFSENAECVEFMTILSNIMATNGMCIEEALINDSTVQSKLSKHPKDSVKYFNALSQEIWSKLSSEQKNLYKNLMTKYKAINEQELQTNQPVSDTTVIGSSVIPGLSMMPPPVPFSHTGIIRPYPSLSMNAPLTFDE